MALKEAVSESMARLCRQYLIDTDLVYVPLRRHVPKVSL